MSLNLFFVIWHIFFSSSFKFFRMWPREIGSISPLVHLPTSTHRLQYLNLRHNCISFFLQIRLTVFYYFKRELNLYPFLISFPSSPLLSLRSYFWNSLIFSCSICPVLSLLSPVPTILHMSTPYNNLDSRNILQIFSSISNFIYDVFCTELSVAPTVWFSSFSIHFQPSILFSYCTHISVFFLRM